MNVTFHGNPALIDWETLRHSLIDDDFHNGRTIDQLRRSFENSQMQVYAMMGNDCVGTARALSDGIGNAYVIDVWTHSPARGRGIAREMMQRLLEAGPGQHFYLQTDDAVDFYRKLGFKEQPVGMSMVSGQYLEERQ